MRRYTSKKYTYTPAQGVKSDFETLLQKFTETGTVRFQSFAEIWKEMKFSKYCAGRQTLREVREFAEECLKIATQFWLPPSSFQVRAGALYLLYGLYNFQSSSPKAKIRVTPENWKSVLEFQALCREQQHLDIDYVFQKLKLDRAFQFVATTAEYNPYDTRDDIEGRALPDSLKDDESLLSELYSSQVLNQLAAVHDQYHKMKVSLAGNDDGDELDTSLNIINNDLIQNIYRTLQSHREKQSHTVGGQQQQSTSQESTSEGEEKYTSLSVKGALKKKAFKTYVRGQRGRGQGKVKPVRFTDTVNSLQDPKVNVCGRLKGRAPKIDIFGREEDVVVGPGVPPSIGVVDMPNILGLEQDKPVKNTSLRKTIKQEKKRGRKKKVVSDFSEEETESKPDIKTTPSDDEWMDVGDNTDDRSHKLPSKKVSSKSSKKASRKASVTSDEASDSPKKLARNSKKAAKKAVKRAASLVSTDDNFGNVSDASPVKTPKKTARMSVENTDYIELKKLKSAEKSSRPKKPSSGKKLKKSSETVSKVHQETVVENKDNSDDVPTGPRKKQRRKKTLEDVVKDITKTLSPAKDADGQISKIQFEKKVNSSVKKNPKVEETVSGGKETSKVQSESKKSKRKLNPDDSDSVGRKKPKKRSVDTAVESEPGKTGKITAAKLVAKSSGKTMPKATRNTSAEKVKKGQKTANLNKKTEDTVLSVIKAVANAEPSAQEKLNKKIAKRLKDKRLSQN